MPVAFDMCKTLLRVNFTQVQCFSLHVARITEEKCVLSYLDCGDVLRPKQKFTMLEMQDRSFMFKLLQLIFGAVPAALFLIWRTASIGAY